MVNFINSWVKGIIIAVIINTIIEMILPEGSIKKYVRTVMGVYIVFTIISPIITKITGKQISITDNIMPKITNNYKLTSIDTNSYVETTYINKIKQDIIKNIEEKGYKVSKIKIVIDESDDNFGNITKMNLDICKKEEKEEKVEPIVINLIEESDNKEKVLMEEEINSLKHFLENNYGVQEKGITINNL